MNKLYIYSMAPIDYFGRLIPYDQVGDLLSGHEALEELAIFLGNAVRAVRNAAVGWEGDSSKGPFVGVPDRCHVITLSCQRFEPPHVLDISRVVGFFWKQRNNGTCFVASVIPLAVDNCEVITASIPILNHTLMRLKGLPLFFDEPEGCERGSN